MIALVPASYTLSPHSAKTTSTPLVPSVVSLHSAQSVAEPWYARAMASSTVSASTILVNSVTSYATKINIISASFVYRVLRSLCIEYFALELLPQPGDFHEPHPRPLRRSRPLPE